MIDQRRLISCSAGTLVVILFLMGWLVFPTPFSDARYYVGAAVSHAQGHGLNNPIYPTTTLDPAGLRRCLYVPLYPWLVGLLMPTATTQAAFAVHGMFSGLCVVLASILLYRAATEEGRKLVPVVTGFVCLALVNLSSRWIPAEGRPEVLATVWLLIGMLAAPLVVATRQWLLLGLLLGLMGATQPVPAVMAAALIGAYLSARFPYSKALVHLGGTAAVSVLVFSLVLAASPNGLVDTVRGSMATARIAIVPGWGGLNYWLVAGRTPFSGFLLVLSVVVAFRFWRKERAKISAPGFFYVFVGFFCGCAYYSSLRAPARNYNILMFMPLLHWALVRWIAEVVPTWERWTTGRLIGVAGLAGTLGLNALGFARYTVLLGVFCQSGTGLRPAQAALAQFMDSSAGPIALSDRLWTLLDDFRGARIIGADKRMEREDGLRMAVERRAPLIVVSSDDAPSQESLERSGYVPAERMGNSGRSSSRFVPSWAYGYGYVVYRLAEPRREGRRISPPRR
jgi:hypothetical protein